MRYTLASCRSLTTQAAGLLLGALVIALPTLAAGPEPVPELRPGILQGYLSQEDFPDSLALLPPPPRDGSAAAKVDEELNAHLLTLQQTARFELAALDNDLHFPEAAGTFACALGIDISKEDTPYLYQLLRRSLTDAGLSTYGAKNAYQRTRPFVVNGAPNCAPEREQELLKNDGSYPSGHTAIGWAWALILTSIAPERADALLQRGMAYGESRMVCNVHWPSDVAAGRIMGAAAVAVLQGNAAFQSDLAMAKQEIAAARGEESMPGRDCSVESSAITYEIYPAEADQ
ncbi:MAG: phosphatase PAP2 family protein [Pseudomonadota bacterium]